MYTWGGEDVGFKDKRFSILSVEGEWKNKRPIHENLSEKEEVVVAVLLTSL